MGPLGFLGGSNLIGQLMPSLFGGYQPAGAPAPAFQPGPMPGLLGGQSVADSFLQKVQQGPDIASLVNSTQQSAPQAPPEQQVQEEPTFGGHVSDFFGGIDNTLQSPSKTIGLGLLNQADPRLGLAGLLASGLFGNK